MPFIDEVFADEVVEGAASIEKSFISFIPLILIIIVFYFFIIRPQQKKVKAHNQLLDSTKKGDKVIISGGIVGVVNKVDSVNSCFFVEIAPDIEVKVLKNAITEVISKEDKLAKSDKRNESKKSESKISEKK